VLEHPGVAEIGPVGGAELDEKAVAFALEHEEREQVLQQLPMRIHEVDGAVFGKQATQIAGILCDVAQQQVTGAQEAVKAPDDGIAARRIVHV
jgi:hypothetical protein